MRVKKVNLKSSHHKENFFPFNFVLLWASLVVQLVKDPPAMPETWVQSLGWEDPLEEGIATDSSILAWRMDRGA